MFVMQTQHLTAVEKYLAGNDKCYRHCKLTAENPVVRNEFRATIGTLKDKSQKNLMETIKTNFKRWEGRLTKNLQVVLRFAFLIVHLYYVV